MSSVPELSRLKSMAGSYKKQFTRFGEHARRLKAGELDAVIHKEHEKVFKSIDCLDCANCCKSLSPIVKIRDIEIMAAHLKMNQARFIDKYLEMDEESDFVFKDSPCPFLDEKNYCRIYDYRPLACREYPHTDRRKMNQIIQLSIKNASICPAVFRIMKKISSEFK